MLCNFRKCIRTILGLYRGAAHSGFKNTSRTLSSSLFYLRRMTSVSDPWKKIEEKYNVHPETKAWYNAALALNKKSYYEMRDDLEGVRRDEPRGEVFEHSYNRRITNFKGTMEEICIPAAHLPKGISTQLYKPEVMPDDPTIIIYVRGGGLVVSQIGQYEQCVMSLVNHTNAIIVLPEYRSLPCKEDRFAPFTDVEAVTEWVLLNKTTLGGVAYSPVGLVGDSAGGQLALSLTYTFSGRLNFQVIVYPVADFDLEVESMKEFWTEIPGFNGRDMKVLLDWSELLEKPSQENNPRVNPSAPRGSDAETDPLLSANPPTMFIIAELDALRDWGVKHAEKIKSAGVETDYYMFNGVPHGFFNSVEHFTSQAYQAHALVGNFVKRFDIQRN